MSRSYKTPWCKQHNPGMKQVHARRMRRKTRQIVNEYKKTMLPEWDFAFWFNLDLWESDVDGHWLFKMADGPYIPQSKEVTNPYDVSDWCFWGSDPKYRRK